MAIKMPFGKQANAEQKAAAFIGGAAPLAASTPSNPPPAEPSST